MDTRIAVIAIIVEDRSKSGELNRLLHEYGEYIVGRMGVPYRPKGVSVILSLIHIFCRCAEDQCRSSCSWDTAFKLYRYHRSQYAYGEMCIRDSDSIVYEKAKENLSAMEAEGIFIQDEKSC